MNLLVKESKLSTYKRGTGARAPECACEKQSKQTNKIKEYKKQLGSHIKKSRHNHISVLVVLKWLDRLGGNIKGCIANIIDRKSVV